MTIRKGGGKLAKELQLKRKVGPDTGGRCSACMQAQRATAGGHSARMTHQCAASLMLCNLMHMYPLTFVSSFAKGLGQANCELFLKERIYSNKTVLSFKQVCKQEQGRNNPCSYQCCSLVHWLIAVSKQS